MNNNCPKCGVRLYDDSDKEKLYAMHNQVPLRLPDGDTRGACDPCFAPLVQAINDGGYQTAASCCGHGKCPAHIMLADGSWIVIFKNGTDAMKGMTAVESIYKE